MKIIKSGLPETSLLKDFSCDYSDSYSAALNAKELTI